MWMASGMTQEVGNGMGWEHGGTVVACGALWCMVGL